MCYNFFRPYIIKEGSKTCPNDALIDLLSKYIAINKCDDAECQFEYVQGGEYEGEGTNFDFYLKSGGTEVFFEIKYTEAGFGKCDNDNRHEEKFKRIYAGLIEVVIGARPSNMRRVMSSQSSGSIISSTILPYLALIALAAARSSHSFSTPS